MSGSPGTDRASKHTIKEEVSIVINWQTRDEEKERRALFNRP